ncbi:MAG TPA: shikimate dehydrogenase [Spirochaetia bacterium]|nr:shikimate dehydrogenase [Spirochaetia bacterium]
MNWRETTDYPIVTKTRPTFYFIGVTTAKSSIMKVFPLWMAELSRPDIVIEGIDCRIHDDPEVYRRAVAQIKGDESSIGGLVTTHKIDLYSAARDMFDFVDPYAETTGELSSISKSQGRLEGHAKDPITVGLSLDAIVPRGYFGRTGGEVLIFGAGGSSVATVLHLANRVDPADRPKRLVVVNRSRPRLDSLKAMVESRERVFEVEYIENADPATNDKIMAELPDYSLVLNATGMGKDSPGSPISGSGPFPHYGVAWEFNYRGDLLFLRQAREQQAARELVVEDGWVYFLHGWTQVVAQVLHIDMTPELFERLGRRAAEATGR